jgi:Zn-dependent protease
MRDPLSWSWPIFRIFGITVRVHLLFPLVALGLVLRAGGAKDVIPGTWIDATMLVGLTFLAVLLHEFGHCYGARLVDGDATEVLLWPLGGLAYVDVPNTPRANFIATAMGPAVNLLLCLLSALILGLVLNPGLQPQWNPIWYPFRQPDLSGNLWHFTTWSGGPGGDTSDMAIVALEQFFWINWVLFLLNVLILGFPLDGGRMLQCLLWPRMGYHNSMRMAIYSGFLFAIIIFVVSLWQNEVLVFFLCIWIYLSCKQQLIVLMTGGEDSMLGYDFSQGYTSLERDEPAPAQPRKKRLSFWQRWLQRRAARKLQREQERQEADERRMDELLEKIQREGRQALTEEENRFLKRVADRYRNRP